MIKHYAEDVVYEIDGWMQKNKDTLHEDVTKLMQDSTSSFIAGLFVVCLAGESSFIFQGNYRGSYSVSNRFGWSVPERDTKESRLWWSETQSRWWPRSYEQDYCL